VVINTCVYYPVTLNLCELDKRRLMITPALIGSTPRHNAILFVTIPDLMPLRILLNSSSNFLTGSDEYNDRKITSFSRFCFLPSSYVDDNS
jgi:hypothetical protein